MIRFIIVISFLMHLCLYHLPQIIYLMVNERVFNRFEFHPWQKVKRIFVLTGYSVSFNCVLSIFLSIIVPFLKMLKHILLYTFLAPQVIEKVILVLIQTQTKTGTVDDE